jgi:hypothetical protein
MTEHICRGCGERMLHKGPGDLRWLYCSSVCLNSYRRARNRRPSEVRTCRVCAQKFAAEPRAHMKVYCSSGCRHRQENGKRIAESKTCGWCGAGLVGARPKLKEVRYCGDNCETKARLDRAQRSSEQPEQRDEYEVACLLCGRGRFLSLTKAQVRMFRANPQLRRCLHCGGGMLLERSDVGKHNPKTEFVLEGAA